MKINRKKFFTKLEKAITAAGGVKKNSLNGSFYLKKMFKTGNKHNQELFEKLEGEYSTIESENVFENDSFVYNKLAFGIRNLYLETDNPQTKRLSSRINTYLNKTFMNILSDCVK